MERISFIRFILKSVVVFLLVPTQERRNENLMPLNYDYFGFTGRV